MGGGIFGEGKEEPTMSIGFEVKQSLIVFCPLFAGQQESLDV